MRERFPPATILSAGQHVAMDDEGQAQLPIAWTCRDEFQELQGNADDLLHLWEVVGVPVADQILDTQAVLTAALHAAQKCLASLDLRRAELERQCEDLETEILEHLQSLAAGRFAKELSQAKVLPLDPQATTLQQLLEEVLKALQEQDQLRKDLAEACAAMGLDPSQLADFENLSPEELQKEAEKRKQQVQQQLEELAMAMGVDVADLPQDGDLGAMAAKLKELQKDMSDLKDRTLENARRCKEIWDELRLGPTLPRDAAAEHLSLASSAVVNAAMAAQVRRSLEAWEAQRESSRKEAELLHEQIRGHAVDAADAEAFLAQHAALHQEDLDSCRIKLQDLKEACRAAEKPLRQHLRQLYHKTGCDTKDLEQLFRQVEDEATARARRKCLENELRRMEDYAESISVILGQREELKALVLAGESFERAAQAGEGRWVGSSKHFLEEEKFRKRFLRQYPQLRDQIIESIEQWEESNSKTFSHKGIPLGDRLRSLREHEAVLASAKGDLSIMGILLQALGIDQDAQTGRPQPSKDKVVATFELFVGLVRPQGRPQDPAKREQRCHFAPQSTGAPASYTWKTWKIQF
eukprot:s3877_g1.t2